MNDGTERPYGQGRLTPQRALIATIAAEMPGAFSIDRLAEAVSSRDAAIGVATVYRAVAALLDNGWIERVGEQDGRALFVRCHAGANHHHHHVVCEGCGRVEVAECPVSVTREHAGPHAFTLTRHEITLYGLCPECLATHGGRTA